MTSGQANPSSFIRPARPSDAVAIARILRDQTSGSLPSESFEATKARVREGLRSCGRGGELTVLVAENAKGRAAGFVSVAWTRTLRSSVDGYITELVVHPRWRGLGLGSRLLEAVRAEARRRGCTRLLLYTDADDACRQGFYSTRGGQESGAALFVIHLNSEDEPLPASSTPPP